MGKQNDYLKNADEDPIWEGQEIRQEEGRLHELEESLEALRTGRSGWDR